MSEFQGRLPPVDIARGVAVLGMFGYHLTWDLADVGFIDPHVPFTPTFRLYSHIVACVFVFLAGASLVLARRVPFRWDRWGRHLAIVCIAAAAVTLASALLFPQGLIGFGILHCIAAAILLATPFLFLPPVAALVAALVIAALPLFIRSDAFNAPALIWTGLGTVEPSSNDFRPFFPWAAPAFAGVSIMAFAEHRLREKLARWRPTSKFWRLLAFGGRHSLAIYLLHQPIFLAVLAGIAAVVPATGNVASRPFVESCERECTASGAAMQACARTCGCVGRELRELNLSDRAAANSLDEAEKLIVSRVTQACLKRRS